VLLPHVGDTEGCPEGDRGWSRRRAVGDSSLGATTVEAAGCPAGRPASSTRNLVALVAQSGDGNGSKQVLQKHSPNATETSVSR